MTKAVKKIDAKEVTLSENVALEMYQNDAGNSYENVDKDSLAIPFLKILQALSPECNEDAPEYVLGAKAGMFFNSVSREVLGASVTVIPCYYKRVFNKWGDRTQKGGFKGNFEIDSVEVSAAKVDSDGRLKADNSGDYFLDTRNHYVLIIDSAGNTTPAILALVSSQIKKSKRWHTIQQMQKMKDSQGKDFILPMFAMSYTLTTVSEKNDKGAWKGIDLAVKEPATSAHYLAAKLFADLVKANKVEATPQARDEY